MALEPLLDAIKTAKNTQEKKASIDKNFDLNLLMPEKHFFYTYHGSLTTPPHEECVIWTILRRHVHIGHKQVSRLLRTIFTSYIQFHANFYVNYLDERSTFHCEI